MKFKNIIQNLGANLLITLLGLVGSIILARWLGPSQRGVFAAIVLIPTFVQYFVNFGLSSATIYFTAKPNADKDTIWSNLLLIGSIQSIIGLLIGFFISFSFLKKYGFEIANLGNLYLFTIPLGLFGMYATYILQGSSQFKIVNYLKCIVPSGYFIAIILLKSLNNLSVQNLIFVQLIIQSLYLITAIFFLYKTLLTNFIFKIDYGCIHQMFNYGVKVWFGDVSQLINSRIDQFLIGAFLSTKDLGIYIIAVSTAGFTGIFANAVTTIMLPSVSSKDFYPEKKDETIKFFKKYWVFSIFIHLFFALSLPILIPLIFGNDYYEAVIIGQILIIGNFFINAKTVLGAGLSGMGFPELISTVEIIGMTIALIMSVVLIIKVGLVSVSLAISSSYFVQFVALILFTDKKGIALRKLVYISPNEFRENLKWLQNITQRFK